MAAPLTFTEWAPLTGADQIVPRMDWLAEALPDKTIYHTSRPPEFALRRLA